MTIILLTRISSRCQSMTTEMVSDAVVRSTIGPIAVMFKLSAIAVWPVACWESAHETL